MSGWDVIDEDAGLFTLLKTARSGWCWRTVVLRVGEDLAVVSPTRDLGDDAHRRLARLGRPRWLFASNSFHHLGIPEWRARYPGSEVVASARAAARVATKTGAAVLQASDVSLPAHARALSLEGARAGELWLSVDTPRGRAWIVGDAFFNLPRHATGFEGAMLRLFKTTAGLRIGSTFLLVALSDRAAYASWLRDRVDEDRPTLLVPAHGDTIESLDLPAQIAALAADRL